MNLKNKMGLTLTVLVITIIIMFILFAITFSTATVLIKESQKNKMKTMLYMVKSRAEILLENYLFDNEGNSLSSISDDVIESYLAGRYVKSTNGEDLKTVRDVEFETEGSTFPGKDEIIYCIWNQDVLKSQGIDTENLAERDNIIVQYNIEENRVNVASKKGFSDKNVGIHKLSEF